MFMLFGINVFARDEDTSIKNSPFSTKHMFNSREELFEWTQNKARSLGYVIINRRSKAYANNFVYKVVLMCDRSGEFKATNMIRAFGTRKTNCKFELEGKYSKEHNKWTSRVICDDHNHPPTQHMEGHPYVRHLSVDETRLVEDLTIKNLAPRDILSTLKAQKENNASVAQTIYNAQEKIRRREQAGKTPMQVLMSILHANNYLYELTTGDSNELENLFFVHPTSWKIWRAFPHVSMIDVTYKTNKYIIRLEKEANYTWVLNCVKSILDKCMHPRIITLDEDHKSFRILWRLLVESSTLMAYMENYKRLQSMLINYPRKLVHQHLNFGNNTTNRAESQRSKLKKNLNSSNSNLDKFVQRISQVVRSQLTSINESFENSLTVRYNHHNLSCFQLLRGHVSNQALDIILGEIQSLGDLMLDTSNRGQDIPLDSIDIFWRKLDISDTTSAVDDDINCDDVVDKFKENFN
uniref:Protein FAR1-RELATED SEQUENCE n=1 Tax=Lactuca sativa TaxID=4236 RepID=A0A9R1V0D1_LACSA|nr:hypothetical protein LSAT_V11C700368760 [Lactuca sativa]